MHHITLNLFLSSSLFFSTSLGTLFLQNAAIAQPDIPPKDNKELADQIFDQANAKYNAGDFDAALHLWQQALEMYRSIKDSSRE